MYSGTDLLWASLLDKLWKVSRAVRLHRASISLSDEVEGDSEKSKQIKRKAALRSLVMNTVFSLAFGVLVTTGFLLSNIKSKILVFSRFHQVYTTLSYSSLKLYLSFYSQEEANI